MKITEDILVSIGFYKKEHSENPVLYFLPANYLFLANKYNKEKVIIGKEIKDGKLVWSLMMDEGDCTSFVKEIQTLNQMVCVISEFAFDLGDKSRKFKFKQALED